MQTQNIKPQRKKTPALLLTSLLLSSVALSACQTHGPVLRPQAQVVLPPMPDRPQAKGAQTARHELLQPQTPTPQP